MDLNFSPDEQAFREEVRAFVRDKLPDAIRRKVMRSERLTRDENIAWQRTLHARGWSAPGCTSSTRRPPPPARRG